MNQSPPLNEIQTPRQLLPGFYKQYRLGNDGGQSSPYVKIEFSKRIFVYFPNFDARRKAVFKHDVHHIATGYTSTFKGETEISAWELGSGCRHYWVAFLLDLYGMTMGMLFNPGAVYRAFVKGRRTKNLYGDAFTDAQLMDIPLADIKEHLLLTGYPEKKRGNFVDFVLFLLLLLVGALYAVLSVVLLPLVLLYTVYIIIRNKR